MIHTTFFIVVVYLGAVLEYEDIFVILIDDSLVINIKYNLNRWGRGLEPSRQIGVGSSYHTAG
jgi:hypothetical protein